MSKNQDLEDTMEACQSKVHLHLSSYLEGYKYQCPTCIHVCYWVKVLSICYWVKVAVDACNITSSCVHTLALYALLDSFGELDTLQSNG